MEGVGTGLASQGGQGEDHRGQTVAKRNNDDAEMDCLAIANGKAGLMSLICWPPTARESKDEECK
jgi:hypothetical protein